MLDQDTCARPVIVTLPGQITTANAEQAAGQISAAFTPGVRVVVADLTCTACRDRSAIRHLLRAHRTAAARGRQVRFAIRPNLVSRGGLIPVMALAERAGLEARVRRHVTITAKAGVYPEVKVGCLVAGMAAGADLIDDMDLLRHGAMPDLFDGVRAPSTLGSFLRSFTWGNVRQLEAAGRELLAELARLAPLLPRADQLAFVDVDSMQRRVGHKKQGAAFGHTKISGKTVLVRGLNTLAATVCTPVAAPVIAGTRLRGGNANTARGAAGFAAEAIGAARAAGCTGTIVTRADSGVLHRGVHRRLPTGRGVLLGHRPDGPRGPSRDRRDTPGRLDRDPLSVGDLG